ncbi:MAG: ATP-binding protein [bacterium]
MSGSIIKEVLRESASLVGKIWFRLQIRHKLILVFLPLPLLAMIVIGSLWYWNTLEAVRKTIEGQTLVLARNTSLLLDDYFHEREVEIHSVARLKWIEDFLLEVNKSRSPQVFEKYGEKFKKLLINLDGGYFQITLSDLHKQPVAKVQLTSFFPQEALPVHFESRIFDDLDRMGITKCGSLARGEIYVSDVTSIRGFTALVFGTPVFSSLSQRRVGAMNFVFPVSQVAENVIEKYNLGFASQTMIVDKSGQLVYHSQRNKVNQTISVALPGLSHVIDRILAFEEFTSEYQDDRGEKWVISYASVSAVPWSIGVASPVQPFIRSTRQAGIMGIALTLAACLILLYLINLFSKKFVRDIAEVTEGARALAAGDLERQLPVRSDDEIGELADDFNKMAKDLKRMMHEVDIHKNLAAIGQFAASMYHDLKSPLEGLKFLSSGMKRKTKENDPLKPYVDEITIGVQNLDRLIYETLDFVKPKTMNCQEVDLNELLQSVVQELKTDAIDFRWKLSSAVPRLQLDASQMKHAIMNLVNNAVEAMPAGGEVHIQTTSDPQSVRFEIADTGAGMKPEELEKIFQPFYSTKKRGHGLGLSLAHQIIKNHNGEIKIESKVGQGTRVIVILPVRGNSTWQNN